jgi:AcrR family transcriptional regulator
MSSVQKYGVEGVGDVGGGNDLNDRLSFPRLRPGPGQQAERVASHQRLRLHQAMLQLVAEEGYDSITVRKLAGLAGVSSASFYARFDGKEECFLASCAVVLDRIRDRVQAARSHHIDQRTQLTRTAEAFLAEPTAHPAAVRVALVDSFSGGPAALNRIREFEATLEADVNASLSRRAAAPSATVTAWITAGWFRACRNLVCRGVGDRDQLASRLATWGMSFLDEIRVLDRPIGTAAPAQVEGFVLSDPPRFDERDAILAATIKLALSDGYWQLHPSNIRKGAGVSRAVFNAHFDGADDCYLAAVADLIRGYLSLVFGPRDTADASPQALHQAVITLTRRLAAEPERARLAFVGILDPGSPGVQLREQLVGEFSAAWHQTAAAGSDRDLLPAEATLSAFWGVIARRVEANAAVKLPFEAPTLTLLLLAPSLRGPVLRRPTEVVATGGVGMLNA